MASLDRAVELGTGTVDQVRLVLGASLCLERTAWALCMLVQISAVSARALLSHGVQRGNMLVQISAVSVRKRHPLQVPDRVAALGGVSELEGASLIR